MHDVVHAWFGLRPSQGNVPLTRTTDRRGQNDPQLCRIARPEDGKPGARTVELTTIVVGIAFRVNSSECETSVSVATQGLSTTRSVAPPATMEVFRRRLAQCCDNQLNEVFAIREAVETFGTVAEEPGSDQGRTDRARRSWRETYRRRRRGTLPWPPTGAQGVMERWMVVAPGPNGPRTMVV